MSGWFFVSDLAPTTVGCKVLDSSSLLKGIALKVVANNSGVFLRATQLATSYLACRSVALPEWSAFSPHRVLMATPVRHACASSAQSEMSTSTPAIDAYIISAAVMLLLAVNLLLLKATRRRRALLRPEWVRNGDL